MNNYSSLPERQVENISNILSSTASTNREVSEVSRGAFQIPAGAPPFQHYQLTASSSASSVHENQLQTMFYGNAITGGVFNINIASSQSAVSSLESEHRRTGRGGEGGCSPPKFWATPIFWAARENLGKASF